METNSKQQESYYISDGAVIISRKPSFIVRYGLGIFCFMFLGFYFFSGYLTYAVKTKAVLEHNRSTNSTTITIPAKGYYGMRIDNDSNVIMKIKFIDSGYTKFFNVKIERVIVDSSTVQIHIAASKLFNYESELAESRKLNIEAYLPQRLNKVLNQQIKSLLPYKNPQN